jgi:hypothetical protein
MNIMSFGSNSSPTKDEVVSKKGMDGGTASTQGDSKNLSSLHSLVEPNREFINGNHEQVGRKWTTLANSSRGGKSSGFTIDQN